MATEDLEYEYAIPHSDVISSIKNSGINTTDSSQTLSPGKSQPLSRRQRKNRTRLQREQQQESCSRDMAAARRRKLSKDESEKSSSSESGIGSQDSLKSDEVQQESSSLNEDETSDSSDTKESEREVNKVALETRVYSNFYPRLFSHTLCEPNCLVRYHSLAHLDDVLILNKLKRHILTEEQLIRNGFPIIYEPEKLVFDPLHKTTIKQKDIFCNKYLLPNKVYFKSWKPKRKNKNILSVCNQDNSSDDEESFAPGIIIKTHEETGDIVEHLIVRADQFNNCTTTSCEKVCQRCNNLFKTKYNVYDSCCCYHPETAVMNNERYCVVCQKNSATLGCMMKAYHVWSGYLPGLNGPCPGFVCTKPGKESKAPITSVYSLDCEMCYSHNGLELTQVTLVDLHGTIVYSEYVYPVHAIIDYNTRFSGITQKNYHPRKTVTEVQKDLCSLIDENTILIGHGLENDLRALKIVHKKLIDTSLLFANEKKRTSLRNLALSRLGKSIQVPTHNSAEDARTTLELVLRFMHLKTLSTEKHDLSNTEENLS